MATCCSPVDGHEEGLSRVDNSGALRFHRYSIYRKPVVLEQLLLKVSEIQKLEWDSTLGVSYDSRLALLVVSHYQSQHLRSRSRSHAEDPSG